jgi:CelD/BcsL family acetyltransferase involved in cellulose biosynthesis
VATSSEPRTAAVAAPVARHLELGDLRWLELAATHPDALAFHRREWAEAIADVYGFEAFVLGLEDERGGLAGGLPVVEVRGLRRRKRWVSLPFTDACPPLVRPGADADVFAAAVERARAAAGVELNVRAPLVTPGAVARAEAVTHALPLAGGPDALFAAFHKTQQRNVRKAGREHVEVRTAERESDLTRTYFDLHVQTRRRLGVPAQPRRFFAAIWQRLLEPGHGRLLLAYAEGAPVAGLVLLEGGRTVTYKYGASDATAWRLRANHLLFWEAIRDACAAGYATFDFGRSDLPDEGLRAFKSSWGAAETPLVYTALGGRAAVPAATGEGRAGGLARTVLQHSPPWVCRAAGQLLYRYAA